MICYHKKDFWCQIFEYTNRSIDSFTKNGVNTPYIAFTIYLSCNLKDKLNNKLETELDCAKEVINTILSKFTTITPYVTYELYTDMEGDSAVVYKIKAPKKMTLKQIEKELGYAIELIE